MCDTILAFGQRGSHFFQCPTRREHARLPRKLINFLTSSQLKHVHHVALGFQDSFLLTWRDHHGNDHIESSGLPPELVSFLYARNPQRRLMRDITHIRCTLGPYNSSFFVHDGSSYVWMNIPGQLLSSLQSRTKDGNWIDRPRFVALGANEDFLLVTEKHAAVWNLGNYRTASNLLEYSRTQQRGISEIHNIVLHPYRFQTFVTQSMNGSVIYENLPPHALPGIQAMVGPIMRDTKEMERQSLAIKESNKKEAMQRRPSALQQRAQLKKEWGEHTQEFTKQAKGIKLSLSLSVSMGGIARMLG
ncbi:hypothetical protein BKA66DRAFT_420439 [Pyrenochaeta sp. MPI-SDFR-AT-0127]|nr:hypothetical protein BKA66DRAFT_420439 [Pyrenochaeta sp. MPI-SDFR-AT-0127]